MAALPLPPFVSVEEYLHGDYEPDMDYVDGFLEERYLGERDHADLQTFLAYLFLSHRKDWQLTALVEQRVQVSPTRFRVPDVCVLPLFAKRTPIVEEAPLLCIEVLSPEDRLSRVLTRCEDYLAMGVPEIWIFHPPNRQVLIVRPGAVTETLHEGTLTLEGTPISLSLAEIFSALDTEN